jgi:ubiquinone biosynthesis protein
MPTFTQLLRLFVINWVMLRHGLDELVLATKWFRPVRWIRYALPWHWWPRQLKSRGVRIRRTLEDLGPIFVKFGQILSTRRDLLPDDIARELARLQDKVPPFASEQAVAIIEQAFERPVDELFAEFSPQPLASASIAQVHAARLHEGTEVVVKVLRPNILSTIRRDISLMYIFADKLHRYWPAARRFRPLEVVAEFEKTILNELDLMREAANAGQLKRNFRDSSLLYVPEVYYDLTRENVMVMERIHGIPISDVEALRRAGVNIKRLAENGVEIFFTQVFRDSFFHADMHPGNIFVASDGRYMAVDFGIMGTLNPVDQRYLAENFLAFFNRDYRRVAELHVDSGWVRADTRIDEFESALRTVLEPIFDKPLKDISFGHLLVRLFQVARQFEMEVQPQLVLLQKTLINVEGLGRMLYPELDLWQTAKPFLERWMSEQVGARSILRHLRENIPQWAERLPRLPNLLDDVLRQARNGELKVQWESEQLEQIRREIRAANRRTFGAITGGTLVVSAALIQGLDGYSDVILWDAPLLAWLLGIAGVAVLLAAWPWRQ